MIATKKKAPPTPPPPVDEQVHELSENVLMCRDMRHAYATEAPYFKIEVEGGVRGALYVERVLACMRCDTKRIEMYRVHPHRLERLKAGYKRPKGYDLKGVKKSDKVVEIVRFEQYQRSVNAG